MHTCATVPSLTSFVFVSFFIQKKLKHLVENCLEPELVLEMLALILRTVFLDQLKEILTCLLTLPVHVMSLREKLCPVLVVSYTHQCFINTSSASFNTPIKPMGKPEPKDLKKKKNGQGQIQFPFHLSPFS